MPYSNQPAEQLKILVQVDGRYRLVRVFRARRSDEILGVFKTKADAETAKQSYRRSELTSTWEDW